MAVTSATIVSAVGGKDGDGHRNYTVKYRVLTNSRNDGPSTVLAYASLPTVGSTYSNGTETDTAAFFDGAGAEYQGEEESAMVWLVTARFATSKGSTRDPETPPDDPLTEPPIIETVSSTGKKAILREINQGAPEGATGSGRLIASSAGEPYDPVQEVDDTRYSIRIVKNQSDINLPLYALFKDSINQDEFFGCPPFTVKVQVPGTIQRLFRAADQAPYYRVTWEFAVNMDGWDIDLYDYGMYKLVDGERFTIRGLDGQPLTAPTFLDGAGGVLASDQDPIELTPFRGYKLQVFGMLGLPNSFYEAT
jgi:hypothetical protein